MYSLSYTYIYRLSFICTANEMKINYLNYYAVVNVMYPVALLDPI